MEPLWLHFRPYKWQTRVIAKRNRYLISFYFRLNLFQKNSIYFLFVSAYSIYTSINHFMFKLFIYMTFSYVFYESLIKLHLCLSLNKQYQALIQLHHTPDILQFRFRYRPA